MHYYSQTFQPKLKNELAKLESLKLQAPYTRQSYKGLCYLPLSCAYTLLDSDEVKAEDEHVCLSYVYHYTRLLREKEGLPEAIRAANQLSKCLRYNFLSLYNVVSAIRRNEAMQLSMVFVDAFTTEYLFRLKMGKLDIVNQSLLPEQNSSTGGLMHYHQRQRRMFNTVKV